MSVASPPTPQWFSRAIVMVAARSSLGAKVCCGDACVSTLAATAPRAVTAQVSWFTELIPIASAQGESFGHFRSTTDDDLNSNTGVAEHGDQGIDTKRSIFPRTRSLTRGCVTLNRPAA